VSCVSSDVVIRVELCHMAPEPPVNTVSYRDDTLTQIDVARNHWLHGPFAALDRYNGAPKRSH
jgi:hypothetical protein